MCNRTDAEEFTESYTQALVEIVVDSATGSNSVHVPLQEVQDQRPQVTCNE